MTANKFMIIEQVSGWEVLKTTILKELPVQVVYEKNVAIMGTCANLSPEKKGKKQDKSSTMSMMDLKTDLRQHSDESE